MFLAKSGFGGTEYRLCGLMTEGRKREPSWNRLAELTQWNPAQRFGPARKDDIAVGFDADLALVDPDRRFVVRAEDSETSQSRTAFEGLELTGQVKSTCARGRLVYGNGRYLQWP